MKEYIGDQGEIGIFKLTEMPKFTTKPHNDKTEKGFIISHSKSGNHHILTGGAQVLERVENVPEGMRIFYAILDNPEQLIQDAPVPHGHYDLDAGVYEFRIAREYDPLLKKARQVAD